MPQGVKNKKEIYPSPLVCAKIEREGHIIAHILAQCAPAHMGKNVSEMIIIG